MPSTKVYKKTTPGKELTVYLSKRCFIDRIDFCEPITGVILVDDAYLNGRLLYGQLTVYYKYGHKANEVMGVKMSKELTLKRALLYPMANGQRGETTALQNSLLKKLGGNSWPFKIPFPAKAPNSVIILDEVNEKVELQEKPLGVYYLFQVFVAASPQSIPDPKTMIEMEIIKLQHAPESHGERLPSSLINKQFLVPNGSINFELTLDRDLFYHGEEIPCTVTINNNTSKTIRSVKGTVYQEIDYKMLNTSFKKKVASLEVRDGCPIAPGIFYNKVITLRPTVSNTQAFVGVAIDGYPLNEPKLQLATSTMTACGNKPMETIGIVVSYSVCVELDIGVLDRLMVNSVPIKILNPMPGSDAQKKGAAAKKQRKNGPQKMDTFDNGVQNGRFK